MKIMQTVLETKQIGTRCDVCGKECETWEAFGHVFSGITGACCEFCEDCFDKVVGYVKSIGGVFQDLG